MDYHGPSIPQRYPLIPSEFGFLPLFLTGVMEEAMNKILLFHFRLAIFCHSENSELTYFRRREKTDDGVRNPHTNGSELEKENEEGCGMDAGQGARTQLSDLSHYM